MLLPGLGGSIILERVMKLLELELGMKLGTLGLLFWYRIGLLGLKVSFCGL